MCDSVIFATHFIKCAMTQISVDLIMIKGLKGLENKVHTIILNTSVEFFNTSLKVIDV